MAAKSVTFKSDDAANSAIFYLLSCPAHATCPTSLMKGKEVKFIFILMLQKINV